MYRFKYLQPVVKFNLDPPAATCLNSNVCFTLKLQETPVEMSISPDDTPMEISFAISNNVHNRPIFFLCMETLDNAVVEWIVQEFQATRLPGWMQTLAPSPWCRPDCTPGRTGWRSFRACLNPS